MNNNESTFIGYDEFAKKFTKLKKDVRQRLIEREDLKEKSINSPRSILTEQIKTSIEDAAESESIRRVITETIATYLKDIDAPYRIKIQALIEPDVYKEIMEHLNRLEKTNKKSLASAKEALINKYMTSSVLSTMVSRSFQNCFTEKCTKYGTDAYYRYTTNHRAGALIEGIGVALISGSSKELSSENGGYFYIQDAIAYTSLLQKKQEKHLRRIVGDSKLPSIISKAKQRQIGNRGFYTINRNSYMTVGDSSAMCKFANFKEFFSTVCAAPSTVSILTAMQSESESEQ